MAVTAPARILVVDDNAANRDLARSTLEDEGYEVVLASGGLEALEKFRAGTFDCILLDVRMPDMDGIAVCERLRAMPEGADVPVLFFTALRDLDTFDRALRAGGNDFLTKPVRPTELVVRVQAAIKLRRLSGELHEQYAVLRQQRDHLFRLQLQKERLTAFVVHDLKNPVNAMDLHAQLIVRDKTVGASARESAAQIRTEARHLTRLILNLLDISKADEGQLTPRLGDVDLASTVAEVFAELDAAARARRVELRSALAHERLRADGDLLRRAMTNLVENAIRHAPEQTAVTVSSSRSGGGIELRVADQGSGVPTELRDRIFDPFVQAETAAGSGTRLGRGLGLTFCKAAVAAHGGTILVEDGTAGAVFLLLLPEVS
jgi:signal transduction histidine kinase